MHKVQTLLFNIATCLDVKSHVSCCVKFQGIELSYIAGQHFRAKNFHARTLCYANVILLLRGKCTCTYVQLSCEL